MVSPELKVKLGAEPSYDGFCVFRALFMALVFVRLAGYIDVR
jgi:hypothetical protein